MKQIHRAKRPRGSASGQEPLAVDPRDPRDPDIVHAHRITRRSRPGADRQRSGSHDPAAPDPGR